MAQKTLKPEEQEEERREQEEEQEGKGGNKAKEKGKEKLTKRERKDRCGTWSVNQFMLWTGSAIKRTATQGTNGTGKNGGEKRAGKNISYRSMWHTPPPLLLPPTPSTDRRVLTTPLPLPHIDFLHPLAALLPTACSIKNSNSASKWPVPRQCLSPP